MDRVGPPGEGTTPPPAAPDIGGPSKDAKKSGALVDGLEREYAHVMALLTSHGWARER